MSKHVKIYLPVTGEHEFFEGPEPTWGDYASGSTPMTPPEALCQTITESDKILTIHFWGDPRLSPARQKPEIKLVNTPYLIYEILY